MGARADNWGMTVNSRRALVVEDDNLVASLIATALDRAGFIVEQAASFAKARRLVDSFDPDVVLIDISLGDGPTGIDLARLLAKSRPDIGGLILTRHPDARTAGASEDIPEGYGFLRKETVGDTAHLVASIESVLNDRGMRVRHDRDPGRPFAQLTTKQIDLLRFVAQGLTNGEIASRLEVSNSAIEQRLSLIFKSLNIADIEGVSPRAEAMRIFILNAGLPERD